MQHRAMGAEEEEQEESSKEKLARAIRRAGGGHASTVGSPLHNYEPDTQPEHRKTTQNPLIAVFSRAQLPPFLLFVQAPNPIPRDPKRRLYHIPLSSI